MATNGAMRFRCVVLFEITHFIILKGERNMELELFENPGKKLQKLATVLFWVEVVCSVILAFALGLEKNYRSDYSFYAGIFFGFLIGGPIVSYCSSLFLYAFGELVEKVNEIHKTNSSTDTNAPMHASVESCTRETAQSVDRVSYLMEHPNQRPSENTWLCTCGRCNPRYMSSCVCGKSKYDNN